MKITLDIVLQRFHNIKLHMRNNISCACSLLNRIDFFVLYSRLPRFIWGDEDGGYGEKLLCEQKPRLNVVDRYAMAVQKDYCIIASPLAIILRKLQ